MPRVRSKTEGAGAAHKLTPSRRGGAASRLLRRTGRPAIAICAIALFLLAGGFGWFLWNLPAGEIKLERDADGIVVLTGGASRISDAMELLAAGRGKRLLISGLNRTTTSGEISRLNPEFGSFLNCCVDFDRSLNTFGNATETRQWAQSRGFRSLIVVTSTYHMPRAMAEIANQLPDVALLPFPVIGDKLKAEPWWTHGSTLRLMVSEYLKYIAARVRIRLDPAAPPRAATPAAPPELVQAGAARP
ncbi:MAG TPA: YdcF family protein [Xanthobacteraceae bacterium]|nr:YdcF family protein [Xanthobacteraceae bacterium]